MLPKDDNHFCIAIQQEGLAPRWWCPLRIKRQTDLLLPWCLDGFYPERFLLLYTFQLAKSWKLNCFHNLPSFTAFLSRPFVWDFCFLQCMLYSLLLQRLLNFLYNYHVTQIILNGSKQRDCERVEEKEKFVTQKIVCKQKYFSVSSLDLVPIATDGRGSLAVSGPDENPEKRICSTFDVPIPSASALPRPFGACIQLYPRWHTVKSDQRKSTVIPSSSCDSI